MQIPDNALRLLTHRDVQALLGVNKDAIYELFQQGRDGKPGGIKAFKLRGQWRCTVQAYNEYVAHCQDPVTI